MRFEEQNGDDKIRDGEIDGELCEAVEQKGELAAVEGDEGLVLIRVLFHLF